MIADFLECRDQFRRTKCVANAHSRKTVPFGKGAHTNDAGMLDRQIRDRIGRRKVDVGFIKQQKATIRELCSHLFEGSAFVPRSHRVIRVCEVNQLCAHFARFGEQCFRVFMIRVVGHLVQGAAETCHMVVECRIRSIGGHNVIALCHQQAHQIAEQPVDAFADDNIA